MAGLIQLSFLAWFRHFGQYIGAYKTRRQIFILDDHNSHKTLDAIDFCRENGIIMITLLPHCTLKIQPLDKTLFKALKAGYNSAADSRMQKNSGRQISLYYIAEIFATAYNTTASVAKAVKGFAVTGIFPCNRNVFTDADFLAAKLT